MLKMSSVGFTILLIMYDFRKNGRLRFWNVAYKVARYRRCKRNDFGRVREWCRRLGDGGLADFYNAVNHQDSNRVTLYCEITHAGVALVEDYRRRFAVMGEMENA